MRIITEYNPDTHHVTLRYGSPIQRLFRQTSKKISETFDPETYSQVCRDQGDTGPHDFMCGSVLIKELARSRVVTASGDQHRAEFIRLPKPGSREPFTGLSRSKLNQLILPSEENGHKPPVRAVVLRKREAIRGVRLIFLDSLIAYIREQAIFSLTDDWDSTATAREVNSLRSNDFGNKSKVN